MATNWKAKFHIIVPKTEGVEKVTRQRIRAGLRATAFAEITAQYPGEAHHIRRSMSLSRARRDYQNLAEA